MIPLEVTLNGVRSVHVLEERTLLVDFLREKVGLRGTRVSCDQGACGACTVLVDGKPVTACMTFAFAVEGTDIQTVEGLANADGELNALQSSFVSFGVAQCGFCTSGMLMLAQGYELNANPKANLVEWMSANICRCSGYLAMHRALQSLNRDVDGEK
jgi:aerobic-type carbon monoxide dehydrogenase small subunit (CoxS/CutS family)